ncbi:MAG: response regulator, partial [Nitrospinae bacterium]|nr:response regulator [Nitrospinota bacterium]
MQFREMKVLVVDDMFNMRRTLKNMLRYIGFDKVLEAGDGSKALELLAREKVDLVVSDWNMPTMTGIDLLRKVRQLENHRNVPFVMITAEISEANIVQAAESEVDGYMIKPFVARSLEEKIKTIFQNRAEPTPMERLMKAGQLLMEAGSFEAAAK